MTTTRYLYDDGSPCLTAYGLPRYPNRTRALAAVPDGWANRARLFRCGAGHYHVGHLPPGSVTPQPIQEDQ